MEEEFTPQIMDNIHYFDDDEAEETLSLSDYSINTVAEGEGEEIYSRSRQLQSSSSSSSSSGSDQEHYFEFCSEEWSSTTTSNPPENIIFCGKLIPYNEPTSLIDFQRTGHKKLPAVKSFRWNGSHNNSTMKREEQRVQKRLSQVHKISLLTSLGKFRWSLFLFGGARLQSEMVLRDIKSRQSRRSPSSTLFGLEGDDKKISVSSGSKTRSQQGLMGLLKAIGCRGQKHANTVVKVSIGCIPRL